VFPHPQTLFLNKTSFQKMKKSFYIFTSEPIIVTNQIQNNNNNNNKKENLRKNVKNDHGIT